jgi:hypothetical protein
VLKLIEKLGKTKSENVVYADFMKLGDCFQVIGQDFRIVGLSAGTSSWMTSFSFIRESAVENLLRVPQATIFLLFTPVNGANLEAARHRIDSIPGVNSVTKTEMSANDLNLYAKVISAPLKLMEGRIYQQSKNLSIKNSPGNVAVRTCQQCYQEISDENK